MTTFVKICGLRDARDVAAAVEAGADAVGFVFAESPRRVTPREARAATADVPRGVRRVAVMLHPSNDELQAVLAEFEADVLQTDADDFTTLDVAEGIECWPVFREGSADVPHAVPGVFVYEGAVSGAGETVDWSGAAGLAAHGHMILAGGLAEDNVGAAIGAVRPFGVDVSSGVESMPGKKDHEKMRRFVAAVRAAEHPI